MVFLNLTIHSLFFYFNTFVCLKTLDRKQNFPMTGIELPTSGDGSKCFTN